jgi:hypothetical protein
MGVCVWRRKIFIADSRFRAPIAEPPSHVGPRHLQFARTDAILNVKGV